MSSTRCEPTLLDQLGVTARDALDRRQHEAGGVEDGPERADPRQVVMARSEEAEQRIGDVRIEDLRRPALPFPEHVRQPVARSIRARVSSRTTADGGLPAFACRRTTGISRRWYEPNSENRKVTTRATMPRPLAAAATTTNRAGGPVRDDVAVAEGQDRAGGEIDRRPEIRQRRLHLVAQSEQDQAVADDQSRRAR